MILASSARLRSAAPCLTDAMCAAAAPPPPAVRGWLVELCVCVCVRACMRVCVTIEGGWCWQPYMCIITFAARS